MPSPIFSHKTNTARFFTCVAQLDLTYLKDAKMTASKRPERAKNKGVVEETTAFDQLVLPDGHTDMILSLIAQHFRDKGNRQDRTDIVRGKGPHTLGAGIRYVRNID